MLLDMHRKEREYASVWEWRNPRDPSMQARLILWVPYNCTIYNLIFI